MDLRLWPKRTFESMSIGVPISGTIVPNVDTVFNPLKNQLCQDCTGSTRRSIFCSQDWFLGLPSGKAEQLSASISVRWETDGIFAYYNGRGAGLAVTVRDSNQMRRFPHLPELDGLFHTCKSHRVHARFVLAENGPSTRPVRKLANLLRYAPNG
jgi:hypothetical protein